jgi:hypothetical protein
MTDLVDNPMLLPDPEPAEVRYTIISVDDHLVEPPEMFEGRLSSKFQSRAPKVVTNEHGHEVWEFEGQRFTQVGMNAVAGRRKSMKNLEPTKFSDMRKGCWDINERVRDMDINGVWASMNFPSMITGFCGRVFAQIDDLDLGYATTQAWNDWLFEEWWQPATDRIIPLGLTFLADPERAPRRFDATQLAVSLRSPSLSGPRTSASRRCSPDTGIQSFKPAQKLTRLSRYMWGPQVATRRPQMRRHSSWAQRCLANSRSRRAPNGCGPVIR